MPELLRMPSIAAGEESASLTEWTMAEAQEFAASDVIVVVETAKAAVDVEAESAGLLVKKLVEPGADVAVGQPLALLAAPGETVADVQAALAALGILSPVAAPPVAAPSTAAAESAVAGTTANGHERVFASPLARKLAREHGLDIEQLTGTGPNGRITRVDVDRALSSTAVPVKATPAPAPAPSVAPDHTDQPATKIRSLIAARLTESKATVPHFYLRGRARVDALLALRGALNAAAPVKISVNDLVVKAVAAAHMAVPEMNVIWTGDAIRTFDSVDVGVAVAAPSGLVTPVVRGVEKQSLGAVATATRDLARRAHEGALKQPELQGGTITVSNLGMFDTEEFAAIINPPQSSILAVGAAKPDVVVSDQGQPIVATTMRVTLSADHRAIDGALAARWMAAFIGLVENPLSILAR